MRTTVLTIVIGAALATGAIADDEVSTVDVLAVLEEINQKLDRDRPVASTGAPDAGFGGGPFMPLRYLPGIADLNTATSIRWAPTKR